MNPDHSSTLNELRRLWILGFAGHRTLADPTAIEQSIRLAIEDSCLDDGDYRAALEAVAPPAATDGGGRRPAGLSTSEPHWQV
jgi:hypothetical protein